MKKEIVIALVILVGLLSGCIDSVDADTEKFIGSWIGELRAVSPSGRTAALGSVNLTFFSNPTTINTFQCRIYWSVSNNNRTYTGPWCVFDKTLSFHDVNDSHSDYAFSNDASYTFSNNNQSLRIDIPPSSSISINFNFEYFEIFGGCDQLKYYQLNKVNQNLELKSNE